MLKNIWNYIIKNHKWIFSGIGILFITAIFYFVKPYFKEEKIQNTEAESQKIIESPGSAQSTGDSSPAIVAGEGSQVNIYYGPTLREEDPTNSPVYEFYYQPLKGKPENPDGSKNYEIGFKNLTDKPILNFEFALWFLHPVEDVKYDFSRSSSNFTRSKGLNTDKTKFHWKGNQIAEDGGWVVFTIRTKNPPNITKLSTKVVGKLVDSTKIIPADSEGLKEILESF